MTKELHILFTAVGRRVELIQEFRKAALNLDVKLKIYGADMSDTAPALYYCDYTRKVCGIRECSYIPELLKICEEDKIDLLIPTIDTDLLILSENKDLFARIGTKVLISEPDKIKICRDKNNTSLFFESCGLKAPRTFNNYELYEGDYPCFIKPKDGSSSINAFKVNSYDELIHYSHKIKDYVIQTFIDGIEYTVDIFCDFFGNPIYIVPRIRSAVRSGEVLKTKISMDESIINECKSLVEKFKPCGPITVQFIKSKTTNENFYIEINPRFGGGAPLSMKAGANSAKTILDILLGKEISFSNNIVRDNAIYSRFDQSIYIPESSSKSEIKGVIFDLDDTLYSEKEYVRSGYNAVAKFLENEEYAVELWNHFLNHKPAIDALLKEKNLMHLKDKCVEVYRKHLPNISLYDGVLDLIKSLKDKGIMVGIITDGRVEGQKNKIKALGLEDLVDDIIITDELGGAQFRKPNDISFRIMQCRWKTPFEQMVYIGDNLSKDFLAPKILGMKFIYFNNQDGIYCFNKDCKFQSIQSFDELISIK